MVDVWILEFWVHISSASAVLHLQSRTHTLRLSQLRTYKKLPRHATAHLSRLHQTIYWSSLSEVAIAVTVCRVSNFMAAYGREIADKRYDGPAAALQLVCESHSVPSPAMLSSVSVTKINRCGHRQMQYSWTRSAPQWCDGMRQWTYQQLNSAWEVEMIDNADRPR